MDWNNLLVAGTALHTVIVNGVYLQSKSDPYDINVGKTRTYILTYMYADDIIVIGDKQECTDEVKKTISK